MEPDRPNSVQRSVRRLNGTTIAVIGGLVLLVLIVAYFLSRGNPDQDKLTGNELSQNAAQASEAPEKLCASKGTYDLIKRELFRRAAQLRGSDQAAFDKLSAYASLRMENPVMESRDASTGAVNCSGSLSLDLPPGVAVVGGRRTLTSDVDYTNQQAADGSGNVVLLRNADAIITPLATLARVAEEPAPPTASPAPAPGEETAVPPETPHEPGTVQEQPPAPAPPASSNGTHPSFDCANAKTKGEIAVCSNGGLAALDRNMAAQYRRAIDQASPEQRQILQRTRDRFIAYRDRCPNRSCIGDAYVGRMREIRDIMEGRWQPPR
jgi:uncharacterized protein YecT (DUF1311 family)